MITQRFHKPLLRALLVCAALLCFDSFLLLPTESSAAFRVAGGGSSGGGTSSGCTGQSATGGIVYVNSAGACVSSNALVTDGNGSVSAAGAVSSGGTVPYTDVGILYSGYASAGATVQNILHNNSNGAAASVSYITSINSTTASTNYCEWGQNSSGFTQSNVFGVPSAGYLDCQNSDLTIGTLGNNTIRFATQSATTASAQVSNNLWTFNNVVTSTLNGSAGFVNNLGNSVGFGRNASSGNMNLYGGANTATDNNADGALSNGKFVAIAGGGFVWSSTTNAGNPTLDTGWTRCAAGVACIGNGTSGDTSGSIKGVTTNSNAPALSIGEFVTSSVASTGATVSISSGTPVTVVSTGAIVTAGDWDVTGVVCYITQVNTSITFLSQGVSTTTNTMGALGSYTADQMAAMVPLATASQEICKPVPATRVSLSGTSNVFLITKSAFTVGTLVGYGSMRLRRVR